MELAARIERKGQMGDGIPGIMAPTSISLLNHHLLFFTALHEQQQKSGRGEEDNIHNAESEAGLQHGARLIHSERERAIAADPTRRHRDVEIARSGEVAAVCLGNVPEFIHTCNQRAHKAEIDEGDEVGRSAR